MVDVITDSKTFTISIIQHADCEIQNLIYPAQIESNDPFTITYDCANISPNYDECFGRLKDNTTGAILNEWTDTIAGSGTKHVTVNLPGRTTSFNGLLEVGYIK